MKRLATSLATLLLLGSIAAAQSKTELWSSPAHLVADQRREQDLIIHGLPATGKLHVVTNVGKVVGWRRGGGRLRLRYRLPQPTFPRHLCLLSWVGDRPTRYYALRVPIFAPAALPIKTRPNAKVSLEIGARIVGPQSSGPTGKLVMHALVPPWLKHVWARVVDDKGLETRRRIGVDRPRYPRQAIAVFAEPRPEARPRYHIAVARASADNAPASGGTKPALELVSPRGASKTLPSTTQPGGVTVAVWQPEPQAPAGRWQLKVASGKGGTQTTSIDLPTVPPPKEPRVAPAPTFFDKLRWSLLLGAGLLHNLGELVSPRITLGGGVDHPLGAGRLGLSLRGAVAWTNQASDLGSGLGTLSSRVVLIPIVLGAHYELSFGRIAPYLLLGAVATIALARTESPATGLVEQSHLAFGFAAMAGARLHLAKGGVFIEAGYQHGQLDASEVAGRVGGLVVQAGYRLELGPSAP